MGMKILTWNLSYGYGIGSEGDERYQPKSRAHFETSLQAISQVIARSDADVVLLQEVDFDSSRSHGVDQLAWIARKSGLLYRSEAISWRHPYIPYPGAWPDRHFGRMLSGGGILSRHSIEPLALDLLAKPRENPRLYNHFYLHRYLQTVRTAGITLCNLHLEAFSKDNRELHLVRLQDRLIDHEIDVAGGDFNGAIDLGESARKTHQARMPRDPTFPSNAPRECFDGFIVKKTRSGSEAPVTLQTGGISDHFPVLIEISDEET